MDAFSSSNAGNQMMDIGSPGVRYSEKNINNPTMKLSDAGPMIKESNEDSVDSNNVTEQLGGKRGNEEEVDEDEEQDSDFPKRRGGKQLKSTSKARNREHAKNTRQRKKDYIESLKDNIKLLEAEREKSDRDRKIALSRFAEQTVVRKKVLQTMFYYRATAEMNRANWEMIMEENFTLVMPITPYRSFPPSEVMDGQRYVRGIPAVILDSASLNVMLQSIALPLDDDGKVIVQFYSGPDESIMADDTFMCKWQMSTTNAVQRGCRSEVNKNGMMKATFSSQNKLTYMEQTFDVMSFMQQLRRASGKFDFLVVPNTLLLAQEDIQEARVIIEANPEHKITFVNQSWYDLFGYTTQHVTGNTISILYGEETDVEKVTEMMEFVERNLPFSTIITCYNAHKEPMRNWIRFYPLYTESVVTHFLCVMEKIVDRFPPRSYFADHAIPASMAVDESVAGSGQNSAQVSGPTTISTNTYNDPSQDAHAKNEAAALPTTKKQQKVSKPNIPVRQINNNGLSSLTNSNEADSSGSDNSTDNNDAMNGDDIQGVQEAGNDTNGYRRNADLTDANLHNINASSGGPFPLDTEPFMCVTFGRNPGTSSSGTGSTGSGGSRNGNGGNDSTHSSQSRSSNRSGRVMKVDAQEQQIPTHTKKDVIGSKASTFSSHTGGDSGVTTASADNSSDHNKDQDSSENPRKMPRHDVTEDQLAIDTSIIDPQTGLPVVVAEGSAPSTGASLAGENQQKDFQSQIDADLSDEDSLDENLLTY